MVILANDDKSITEYNSKVGKVMAKHESYAKEVIIQQVEKYRYRQYVNVSLEK